MLRDPSDEDVSWSADGLLPGVARLLAQRPGDTEHDTRTLQIRSVQVLTELARAARRGGSLAELREALSNTSTLASLESLLCTRDVAFRFTVDGLPHVLCALCAILGVPAGLSSAHLLRAAPLSAAGAASLVLLSLGAHKGSTPLRSLALLAAWTAASSPAPAPSPAAFSVLPALVAKPQAGGQAGVAGCAAAAIAASAHAFLLQWAEALLSSPGVLPDLAMRLTFAAIRIKDFAVDGFEEFASEGVDERTPLPPGDVDVDEDEILGEGGKHEEAAAHRAAASCAAAALFEIAKATSAVDGAATAAAFLPCLRVLLASADTPTGDDGGGGGACAAWACARLALASSACASLTAALLAASPPGGNAAEAVHVASAEATDAVAAAAAEDGGARAREILEAAHAAVFKASRAAARACRADADAEAAAAPAAAAAAPAAPPAAPAAPTGNDDDDGDAPLDGSQSEPPPSETSGPAYLALAVAMRRSASARRFATQRRGSVSEAQADAFDSAFTRGHAVVRCPPFAAADAHAPPPRVSWRSRCRAAWPRSCQATQTCSWLRTRPASRPTPPTPSRRLWRAAPASLRRKSAPASGGRRTPLRRAFRAHRARAP